MSRATLWEWMIESNSYCQWTREGSVLSPFLLFFFVGWQPLVQVATGKLQMPFLPIEILL